MRECAPHLGQTFWLASRSFFQMISLQPSHLSQRPSVLTFRSPLSGLGDFFSGPALSRLNQDMNETTLARVRMASQGRKGAVDLLGEQGARQFVGQGHAGERDEQIGAIA